MRQIEERVKYSDEVKEFAAPKKAELKREFERAGWDIKFQKPLRGRTISAKAPRPAPAPSPAPDHPFPSACGGE